MFIPWRKKTNKGVVSSDKPQGGTKVSKPVDKHSVGGNTTRSSRSVVQQGSGIDDVVGDISGVGVGAGDAAGSVETNVIWKLVVVTRGHHIFEMHRGLLFLPLRFALYKIVSCPSTDLT